LPEESIVKTTRILPICAAIAVALTACGTGGSGGSDAGAAPTTLATTAAVSGEVTFWHAYSAGGSEIKTLDEKVIPAFEAQYPGTTVTAVQIPDGDMHQKLVTGVAGDALPDVIRVDIVTVPELASLKVLLPLDEAMPDFQEWADKMYPGPLATNLYQGKYYGLPLDTNTKVTLTNPAALTAAGLSATPATLEELAAAGGTTGPEGKYTFAEGGAGLWNLSPFIWSNGGDVTNEDYTKSDGFLNGEKSVGAIQMLVDMYNEKAIPEIILGGTGGVTTGDGFGQGLYPMIVDGPWTYPNAETAFPDLTIEASPMFSGEGGSISVVGGENIVITESAKNKDAAAAFVRFMLSDDAQIMMAETGQLSALAALAPQMIKVQEYYAPFLEQLKTAKPRIPTPQYAKINDIVTKKVQAAIQGQLTVQQAMDEAVAEIDPLLAKV